ncbi:MULTISPECIES: hypothetical protein [Pedobacter]|jgi:hypothetical protein|uniref:hypothetical protein n=1 Tax=Pedobacter TaxID=84567 RepID=UPI0010620C77|nr:MULTISPECIES: hypothetical protein [Pedobacter]HWW38731.1 hypothetical protein [Pedobacter sp.]
MNSMSFLFLGLMLVPFVLFIIWLFKQDKTKNYLGLVVLLVAIVLVVIVAIYVDAKYMKAA